MGIINEVGNKYGYLTVTEQAPSKNKRAMWKCQCRCGNEVIVSGKNLRNGSTKSCGCYQKQRAAESNMIRGEDLSGRRFGKLVVIEEDGFFTKTNGKRARLWKCKCDCGNITRVQHSYLKSGDTNSCGCINSIGNLTINKLLTLSGKNFKAEYTFNNFVCNSGKYRFDFALLDNENKLLGLIEYQGNIHFYYDNNGWNTKDKFEERVKRDKIKKEYCIKNNIKLFYITYLDDIEEKIEEIINELYS